MQCLVLCAFVFALCPLSSQGAERQHRTTLILDGTWNIEDSTEPDLIPSSFGHVVPVPGLVHSATPAFADVDEYQTKQLLSSLTYYDRYSQADYDKLGNILGIAHQARSYFWYRRSFQAPPRRDVAILKVNKAQFGTVVYLNGVRIGEHDSCFTAGYFDVSRAIRWGARNRLIVRIGAHPGALPTNVSAGTDFEKTRWTPGIYDSVSLIIADNPVITAVQVAPRLAGPGNVASVLVQTELHNYSGHAVITEVQHQVSEWKSGRTASDSLRSSVQLLAGETKIVTQVIPLPAAHLWSPEDPFLYQVGTSTAGDSTQTRFGMREYHFDTTTQRGYLNGRPYFLRGSNIALHRFFEDPLSGTLPWNESWLRRLLTDIPRQFHWNALRLTIGPVPDRWLDIADETGLLIEYEYSVWVGSPIYVSAWKPSYDATQMISEYTEWMRDSWNHPSVFLWDSTNESDLPEFATKVLPAVRSLDLSNRPWESNYNAPGDANDPVEDHHYFMESLGGKFDASEGGKPFELTDLEWMDGPAANPFTKSAHAKILNEYGWIWLNRDGSPTLLTERLFPKLLGNRNTIENRRIYTAHELAGETELWRAYRRYVGVLHFAYLTASEPNGFTSDAFLDIRNLQLEPHFAESMEQAFKPLGVYLNFWHSAIPVDDSRRYDIHMVNDEDRLRAGELQLVLTDERGDRVASEGMRFSLPPLGAQSYSTFLRMPATPGRYVLQAIAKADDDAANPSISRREVTLTITDVHR
jgi:hypothetical protein